MAVLLNTKPRSQPSIIILNPHNSDGNAKISFQNDERNEVTVPHKGTNTTPTAPCSVFTTLHFRHAAWRPTFFFFFFKFKEVICFSFYKNTGSST